MQRHPKKILQHLSSSAVEVLPVVVESSKIIINLIELAANINRNKILSKMICDNTMKKESG